MEVVYLDHDSSIFQQDNYICAIGNFDGIHQGHREVIRKAVKLSKQLGLTPALMSFDIVPKQLINNISNYYVLRSLEQKKQIIKKLGIKKLYIINFTNEVKNMNADEFIRKMIINNNIKYLVCGFDFHFGKDKCGDINTLQKYLEFSTIILPRFDCNNIKVSSTLIHELILQGKVLQANELLVQPYSIVGKVILGNQKGREIGFPTANLHPEVNYRIPQSGVYATKIIIDNNTYYGMSNIGHNPTFNYCSFTSIETNIFDFNENIYGKDIEVVFYKYIRNEKIFEGIDQLINQLEKDKQEVLTFFNLE